MKDFSIKKAIGVFILGCMVIGFQHSSFAQCKQKLSESTQQTIHYQSIPLKGKHEYLTLSSIGQEKLFSYHNEEIDLVFHAQTFTEIKFTSPKGNFSLFTTTLNRTRWQRCFILSAPLTQRELEKMKGTVKIEIMLPEDHKVFSLGSQKSDMLNKALACLF